MEEGSERRGGGGSGVNWRKLSGREEGFEREIESGGWGDGEGG